MGRHEKQRSDKDRAEDDIVRLRAKTVTYEEEAAKGKTSFSWKKAYRMLWFPTPAKIREIEPISDTAFSPEAHAFYTKRIPGCPEPEDDESAASSAYSSAHSTDTEGDATAPEPEQVANEWRMTECYTFCLKQLIWSRIWIFILQFIGAHYAGTHFRTDAFDLADKMIPENTNLFGDIAVRAFAGLRRWDAQHFLFIADNHYIFEHSLAFFPGFPEIVNILRMWIMYWISHNFKVLVAPWVINSVLSVAVNIFFFHLAGFCMFMVVMMITRSAKRSMLAVSLLAFNPASIFFTAAYSESMFLALTLTGLSLMLFAARCVHWWPRYSGALVGAMVCGLAFCVRSNGILNAIMVAWVFIGCVIWDAEIPVRECTSLNDAINASRNERYRREATATLRSFERKRKQLRKTFRVTDPSYNNYALILIIMVLIVATLIVFFGPYAFMTNSVATEFCNADPKNKELVSRLQRAIRIPPHMVTILDADQRAHWCKNDKLFGIFPIYYGEIQAKYWNVGLFGYWRLKKLPCFLMMLPAAVLTILAIRSEFLHVFQKRRWYNFWVLTGRTDHSLYMAIHAAILLITAVFFINAEVFTRIIFSASPFLYIYLARFLDEQTQGNTPGNRLWHYEQSRGILPFFIFRRVWNNSWQGRLLYIYFVIYFVFGTMAHAAWLPFT